MPKYRINLDNNQTYEIDSEKELNQNDLNDLATDIQRQQKIKNMPKNAANTLYGTARSIGQGASFGQGSHLAGLGQGLGGAAYNLLHGKKVFGDFGKDYTEGREDFKKDYKKFQEEHPYASFAGEMLGAVGTGGALSGATKGILKNAVARGASEGALYGGAYGASNTEGKGFDTTGATIGTGLGAGLGGGLSKAALIGQKFLTKNGGAIKDIAKTYKDVLTTNPLLEKKPQQIVGQKVATVGEVAADENIPYHILKTVDDWKTKAVNGDARAASLLKETANEQFPFLSEQYKNILQDNLSSVRNKIRNIGNEIYKPFDDAIFVADEKSINKALNGIGKKEVKNKAKEILKDVIKAKRIKIKDLREAKQKLYEAAEEISYIDNDGMRKVHTDKGGSEAINYYNNLRKLLTEQANEQIPNLRTADNLYSTMLDSNSGLVSVFGKDAEGNRAINKILADIRSKGLPEASSMLNKIEKELTEKSKIFKNTPYEQQAFDFLKLFQNINDNAKLFQLSYAMKPQEAISVVGKRINSRTLTKTIFNELDNPQRNFRNFVLYGKAGAIDKPAEKAAFDFGRGTIEHKAAQNKLYNKPKTPLYTQKEKENMAKAFTDLYNSRFSKLISRGGLAPKASIRALLNKYYNKEQ